MKLWTRIGVSLIAVVVAFGAVVLMPLPKEAHADSLLKEMVDRAVRAVVKNLWRHPEWTDDELKEHMDQTVDYYVNGWMDADSDLTHRAISDHCWRVYVTAWHPDVYAGRGFAEGPIPGDYLNAVELGNTSIWDQLNVCVRTGYVPWSSPYDEGAMDIE